LASIFSIQAEVGQVYSVKRLILPLRVCRKKPAKAGFEVACYVALKA